jgi:hypothetical protein
VSGEIAEFFDRIEAAAAQVDVRPDGVFASREEFTAFLRHEIGQFIASRLPAPSALDQLDPGAMPVADPAARPAPAVRRRNTKGPVQAAVARDLRTLPKDLQQGAIAAAMISLARDMDQGTVASKDAATVARELRLAWAQLQESKPAGGTGDKTDEVRDARERRLERQQARAAGSG